MSPVVFPEHVLSVVTWSERSRDEFCPLLRLELSVQFCQHCHGVENCHAFKIFVVNPVTQTQTGVGKFNSVHTSASPQ